MFPEYGAQKKVLCHLNLDHCFLKKIIKENLKTTISLDGILNVLELSLTFLISDSEHTDN